MQKPFGGVALPGGEGVALCRSLAAFSLLAEPELDRYWGQFTAAEALPPNPGPGRFWWTSTDPNGRPYWISLEPGEFRETAPDPPCVIHDLPPPDPQVRCRNTLAAAVAACEAVAASGGRPHRLLGIARDRLAVVPPQTARLPAAIEHDVRQIRVLDADQTRNLIDRLTSECLIDLRCEVPFVTSVIAMVQLQAVRNEFVEQDWLADPVRFLPAFLRFRLGDADARPGLLAMLANICNMEFRAGRARVAAARASRELEVATHILVHAYQSFHLVMLLLRLTQSEAVTLPGLEFVPVMAEEAMVCTVTAVTMGAQLAMNHPASLAISIVTACHDADDVAGAIRRSARGWASEVNPTYPTLFADIVAAQAQSAAATDTVVQAGIAALAGLKAEINTPFELGFVNLALLNAYKRIGQDDAARAVATDFATQLVLERVL